MYSKLIYDLFGIYRFFSFRHTIITSGEAEIIHYVSRKEKRATGHLGLLVGCLDTAPAPCVTWPSHVNTQHRIVNTIGVSCQ